MANALQTTYNSLQASLDALAYSNHCLSENVSAIHQAIRENHLVHIPKLQGKESDYFELETLIDNNYYLVLYSAEKSGKDYEINLARIGKCPIDELEYKILSKVEKSIHDQLLNIADKDYYDKHFESTDYDRAFEEGQKGNY